MISIGLISIVLFLFFIQFLFKIKRNNSKKTISNNNIDSTSNIELESKTNESEDFIVKVVEHPIKKQNSFLNPNNNFGTLNKGVVLDNQTYEHEVSDNDSSNFTILEPGDESKEISE